MQQIHSLLLDVYVQFNMFQAPSHPSLGAYNCINSLWFYRWSVGGSSVVSHGLAPRPSSGAHNCTNSLWFYRWSIRCSSVVGRGLAIIRSLQLH
jgi:hypothetical protein